MANEPEQITPERVARVFKEAGYDVTQAVGAEPGVVDWFATKRTGFDRARTYFEVWPSCPGAEGIGQAIEALEERRKARKAERALAVVPTGSLPAGHRTDITGRTAEVVTWKRLVLELSGFVDLVRRQVAEYVSQGLDRYYMPRRMKSESGEVVDVVDGILKWLDGRPSKDLFLRGNPRRDARSFFPKACYESAKAWLRSPEDRWLLCDTNLYEHALNARIPGRFLAPLWNGIHVSDPVLIVDAYVWDRRDEAREQFDLVPYDREEIEAWFVGRISNESVRQKLVDARTQNEAFRKLSDDIVNARTLLAVLDSEDRELGRLEGTEWISIVVHRYMCLLIERPIPIEELWHLDLWEEAALEQFALEAAPRRFYDAHEYLSLGIDEEASWLMWDPDVPQASFRNELIHHYFLARKIAADPNILTRHQFPREYVLLFLALISPEAASIATADRSDEVRKEIEDQVERRLQATLGHQLRRSAGALRAQFNTLKKRLRPEDRDALEYELRRIDHEIEHQRALAEQTRRWHEVPEAAITGVVVRDVAEASLERIAAQYPAIARTLDIDAAIRVRASRDVLQEILDSLIENAFQAITFGPGTVTPRVVVPARSEGDTVRIDVIDNGPGVNPADRERIFGLYVTTKKGGDKPLGTGMGLPIARRYAERVGGMVDIDPDHAGGACFLARFVAWKEPS
ncbi:sensor histidine kinase [Polyangium fumosum]|uniref:histidine kinase n=1 Tax=Polyangium fumosum TaxID=889272 RepID=A0A4V5PNZ2_9BACT|nr:HAMP domain-containing sensor histidine kinase [Polyangium fumosum]TKD02026.1 HAMP domain-containing histidine kinase [Polyangium fumosum]